MDKREPRHGQPVLSPKFNSIHQKNKRKEDKRLTFWQHLPLQKTAGAAKILGSLICFPHCFCDGGELNPTVAIDLMCQGSFLIIDFLDFFSLALSPGAHCPSKSLYGHSALILSCRFFFCGAFTATGFISTPGLIFLQAPAVVQRCSAVLWRQLLT